jgi:hypothetical protein
VELLILRRLLPRKESNAHERVSFPCPVDKKLKKKEKETSIQ